MAPTPDPAPSAQHRFGSRLLRRHPSEVVLTLLTVNVMSHVIAGGWQINSLGVRAPSFPVSLAIWAAFVAWRGVRWSAIAERLPDLPARLWKWRFELALAGLFVVSLWLRLWGNSFGLPVITHPDEPEVMEATTRMLRTGSLNPQWFLYPSLYMYLLLPFLGLRFIWLRGSHDWAGTGRIASLADAHPLEPVFYEVGRTLSGVMGAATVVLVYVLATRLFPGRTGRRGGLVAASLLSFSFLHVRGSHHAVTDATLAFMVTAALIAIERLMSQGRDRDYLVSGFVVGLAGATKYSAIALLLVLGVAHLMGRKPGDWLSRKPALSVAGLAAGFLAGMPYAVFNWPLFLDHMGLLVAESSSLTEPAARFAAMFNYSFASGFGPLLAAALWTSLVVAIHRRAPREILLAVHALAFIALVTNTEIRMMPRYWLPAIPAIVVLIGIYAALLTDWLQKRMPRTPSVGPIALCVVVAIALVPQVNKVVSWNRLQAQPDSRALAYLWFSENLEEGTVVGSEAWIRARPRGVTYDRAEPILQWSMPQWRDRGVRVFLLSDEHQQVAERDKETHRKRERFKSRLLPLRRFPGSAEGFQGPGLTAYQLAP